MSASRNFIFVFPTRPKAIGTNNDNFDSSTKVESWVKGSTILFASYLPDWSNLLLQIPFDSTLFIYLIFRYGWFYYISHVAHQT